MHGQIVIVGVGETAQIAYDYFMRDSDHNYVVAAFAVNKAHRNITTLFNVPVVDLEDLPKTHPPTVYQTFVAASSTHLNRVRAQLFKQVKDMGYTCVSYISPRAFLGTGVKIGENCFIFEDNVIQHHASIGDNVVLWSGNHIGHRTVIGRHAFISSHAVISGFCTIGEYCFLGVNSCFADYVSIADDTVIGMGSVVVKSVTEPNKVIVGNPAKPINKTAYELFNVQQELS